MNEWVKTPYAELNMISNRSVPTATTVGQPRMYTRAGMRMKPPPTPSMPERIPVAKPMARITHREIDSIPEAGKETMGHRRSERMRRM